VCGFWVLWETYVAISAWGIPEGGALRMPPSIILSREKATCLTIDHCCRCLVTASCIVHFTSIASRNRPQLHQNQRPWRYCCPQSSICSFWAARGHVFDKQMPSSAQGPTHTLGDNLQGLHRTSSRKHAHIVFLFIFVDRFCSPSLSVQLLYQLLYKGWK